MQELMDNDALSQLMSAGVHLGHEAWRWNPKMDQYICGKYGKIHIIDLPQTVLALKKALNHVAKVANSKKKILFVYTNKSTHSNSIKEKIKSVCNKHKQFYIVNKWPGGLLTNWQTTLDSIKQMKNYESILAKDSSTLTKKEKIQLEKKLQKKRAIFEGCVNMKIEDIEFAVILDTIYNRGAINECRAVQIKTVAIVDTNADPDGIDLVIPGNDDSVKALNIYLDYISHTFESAKTHGKIDIVEQWKKYE